MHVEVSVLFEIIFAVIESEQRSWVENRLVMILVKQRTHGFRNRVPLALKVHALFLFKIVWGLLLNLSKSVVQSLAEL